MKHYKLLALGLAVLLTLALFTACGKDGKKDKESTPVTAAETEPTETEPAETEPAETEPAGVGGETQVFGDYAVLVPEGFALQGPASEFSYYDFAVKKSDFSYIYFITTGDEEMQMSHYEYNKRTYTNEQEDVEAVYGELSWTGFQYSDGWGGYGFEAYTTVDGRLVRVSSAGFRFDSPEAEAVLGSLAPAAG